MAARARPSWSSASRHDCLRCSSISCAVPSALSAPRRSRSASRTSPICARISRMSSRRVAARAFEVTRRSSPESAGSPSRVTPPRPAVSTRFRAYRSAARPTSASRPARSAASCPRSWTLVRALASRACSAARSRCSFSSWLRRRASFSWSLYASRFLSANRRASNVSQLVLASFLASIARRSSCPDRATSRAATVIAPEHPAAAVSRATT